MSSTLPKPVNSILGAIGNTPVVRLINVVPKDAAEVFVKLEYFDSTGSYKDRMARSMVEEAERRGDLEAGMTIVEATGGIVCFDVFSVEKLRTMATLGAEVDIVPSVGGKFHNNDALVGYGEIGHELVGQFSDGIDAFCGAVGTAGMATGVAGVLRAKQPHTKIVILEPAESPMLTKGQKGSHTVEGIGSGIIPPHLDQRLYDEVRAISEAEARDMCRRLAEEEGLLVGTSTGINIVAAIQLAKELGPGKRVVTVAVDTGLKYLNGTLFADH
ncbi:tryptophan synthase beta subunit-like PLP-dependent enzyme [Trichoderma compactum]